VVPKSSISLIGWVARAALISGSVCLACCGRGDGTASDGSHGGQITVAKGLAEEDLRIGRVDADGPDAFGQINALTVDERGQIYVSDQSDRNVRVFDDHGRFLRTIGRGGRGPGEFGFAGALGTLATGDLVVVDMENQRYSIFDSAGRFKRGVRRPVTLRATPWGGAIGSDGTIFDVGQVHDSVVNDWRDILVRTSLETGIADTFRLPWYPPAVVTIGDKRRQIRVAIPYAPTLRWRVDPISQTIWEGSSDRYRIVRVGLNGDTLNRVERNLDPIPLSRSERADALAFVSRVGGSEAARLAPQIPKHRPIFTEIWVSSTGRLWVQLTRAKNTRPIYEQFDTNGTFLHRVSLPFPLEVFVVRGSEFYGIRHDSLDAEYVSRLRLPVH
jgi:hypothetical protein